MNCLKNSNLREYVISFIIEELKRLNANEDTKSSNSDMEIDEVASFFINFEDITESFTNKIEIEFKEVLANKSCNMSILNSEKFKNVKSMFLKYNAATSFSAPVERLFSQAGIVLGPKRCNLKNDMFEQLTLLKANKKIDS